MGMTNGWQPFETVPEGEHVLLFFREGERGNGGIECATVFKSEDDPLGPYSFWTHGGPNSGGDWFPRDNELPTHWMPLPEFPAGCFAEPAAGSGG
jgi:hypothetical protein